MIDKDDLFDRYEVDNQGFESFSDYLVQMINNHVEEIKRLREQNKLMLDYFWFMRNGGFTDADDLLTKINELIGDE